MITKATLPFDTLAIEHRVGAPAHRQIYDQIRSQIVHGTLSAGTRLPSTRLLARSLGVGRNTIIAAYEQLLVEGYVETRAGGGTCVTDAFEKIRAAVRPSDISERPSLSRRGRTISDQPQFDRSPDKLNFHPGYPETETFPFSTWSKLLARRALSRSSDMLTYRRYSGHPELREEIAKYVGVMRGVACTPDQVIVVTGAQAALDLLARTLLDDGDIAWLEEPGYIGARAALLAAGAQLAPLRVTNDGWKFLNSTLPPPRVIYLTPSCQWPTCRVMSLEERLELLALAREHKAWIIEDDYDAEFRLRGTAVSALQGLDRSGRVIYVGTFGKTLFSSLRLGFIVVPVELIEPFERTLAATGHFAPLLLQATLSDFIRDGHFAAHLRKMRALYAARQSYFVSLCHEQLSEWMAVSTSDSGMQIKGNFVKAFDDRLVVDTALSYGVSLQPLSSYYYIDPPEHGLILGYAKLGEKDARFATAALRKTFQELESASRS